MKLLLSVAFALLFSSCYSYPTGAPESACKDLLPVHRKVGADGEKTSEIIKPQETSSPYTLTIDPGNVQSGETVNVTVSGTQFQGFMIRAYDDKGTPVKGKFLPQAALKQLTCDSADDTATHTSKDAKSNYTAKWQSPADYKGKIVFRVTVAKDYSTFWKMQSGAITVS